MSAVAHLDQQPENNHPNNLKALCQKCHLKHDAPYRRIHFRETIFKRKHQHTHDLFDYFWNNETVIISSPIDFDILNNNDTQSPYV